MKIIKRYSIITLGCLAFAIGFAMFLAPANIAPGGISGIAVIVSHFFPDIVNGVTILLLNIPLLIAGVIIFGGRFLLGTIWASIVSSVFVTVIELSVPLPISTDIFCCALVGGIVMGVGLGFVFRANATTGGTDVIVRLVQLKIPHVKTGNIFMIVDSCIVVLSGIVFRDFDTAVYSGFALWVSTKAFNYILYGGAETGI